MFKLRLFLIQLKELFDNRAKLYVRWHFQLKILNAVILMLTSFMFLSQICNTHPLPDFVHITKFDMVIWVFVLYTLFILQLFTMFRCDCVYYYKWSNTIMLISGFVSFTIGCLFSFKYPPYVWQMSVFPTIGCLLVFIGRDLNKLSIKPKCKKGE